MGSVVQLAGHGARTGDQRAAPYIKPSSHIQPLPARTCMAHTVVGDSVLPGTMGGSMPCKHEHREVWVNRRSARYSPWLRGGVRVRKRGEIIGLPPSSMQHIAHAAHSACST